MKWSQIGATTFYNLNTLQLQNIKIDNVYLYEIVRFPFLLNILVSMIGKYTKFYFYNLFIYRDLPANFCEYELIINDVRDQKQK